MNFAPELKLKLLFEMKKIRLFEEKICELYSEQEMRCPVHLSIGQEATAVGMCQVLKSSDLIFGNHRSHGHFIAKGGSLGSLLAEIYGKATGCCEGIGGSMHLIDIEAGAVSYTHLTLPTTPYV